MKDFCSDDGANGGTVWSAGWREADTLEEYRPGCASFAARSLRNFT